MINHSENTSRSVRHCLRALLFLCLAILQYQPTWAASTKDTLHQESQNRNSFAYNGFSGGMMLHTGYVWSKGLNLSRPGGEALPHVSMRGMPYGIGGAIKINFGEHFRFGTEGYVTNLSYGVSGSNSQTGWGGLLADGYWEIQRFTLFFGATVGGGGSTNVTLIHPHEIDETTEEDVSFRKYGFVCISPYVGFEYALTQRVHLAVKVDWMFNISNMQDDFPMGPRLYFGFMFMHKKRG